MAEPLFSVGEQVEVSQERENHGAAWFAATIGSMISKSIFLVDYKTLRAVTDRELLTEIVDAQYIRPAPPLASEDENFGLHDVVEVLYRGGWSLGVVSQIPNGSKYIVKMKHHEEEMEFNLSEVRSCQVWEDGQWISYSSQVLYCFKLALSYCFIWPPFNALYIFIPYHLQFNLAYVLQNIFYLSVLLAIQCDTWYFITAWVWMIY